MQQNFIAPFEKFESINLNSNMESCQKEMKNDQAMIKIILIKKNEQFQYFEEYKTCILMACEDGGMI